MLFTKKKTSQFRAQSKRLKAYYIYCKSKLNVEQSSSELINEYRHDEQSFPVSLINIRDRCYMIITNIYFFRLQVQLSLEVSEQRVSRVCARGRQRSRRIHAYEGYLSGARTFEAELPLRGM